MSVKDLPTRMQPSPGDVEEAIGKLTKDRADDTHGQFYALLSGRLLANVELIAQAHADDGCRRRPRSDVPCRTCQALATALAIVTAEDITSSRPAS